MARCMAINKEHKRCGNYAVDKQTFCASHMTAKTRTGKSRGLTKVKCEAMRKTKVSPFSSKILSPRARAYGQIYTACRKRMVAIAANLEKRKNPSDDILKLAKDIKGRWVRVRLTKKKVAKKPAAKKA